MAQPVRAEAPDSPSPSAAPASHSRRGFITAAGVALTGGATLGLSGTAAAQSQAAGAGRQAAAMNLARRRTYSALTEVVAGMRGGRGSLRLGTAESRMTAWYAAARPAERLQIDGMLDMVEQVFAPGSLAVHPVPQRLNLLARELNGPYQDQITAAIGLTVTVLRDAESRPAGAASQRTAAGPDRPASPALGAYRAGRLYARMIRALPAKPDPWRWRQAPDLKVDDRAPSCSFGPRSV